MKIIFADQLTPKIESGPSGRIESCQARITAPGGRAARAGDDEEDALPEQHAHADRGGRLLVVADRLERGAEPAAEEHEEDREQIAAAASAAQYV